MRITYSSQADAMYIKLSNAEVRYTKSIAANENIIADFENEGSVIGVEILGVL